MTEQQKTDVDVAQQDIDATSETVEQETVDSETLLAQLQEENAKAKNDLLRSMADMENLRKRSKRDIEQARQFALERFAGDLLPVVDNLERALAVESEQVDALREGVELTLKQLLELLEKHKVCRIEAEGQVFDPHQHEALTQIADAADAGMVIAQHLAGYTLNGRLLRPAKVIVSSGPADEG